MNITKNNTKLETIYERNKSDKRNEDMVKKKCNIIKNL